jgi:hypothetical protein
MTGDTFTAAAREQIRFIQDRLLAVARWANGSGIDDNATEFLVQPYRRLLDEMYERDLPLAKLADQSDLLFVDRLAGCVVRTSWMNRTSSGSSIYAYA